MTLDEAKNIRKEYQKKYNSLEKQMRENNSSNFMSLEKEHCDIAEIIDYLDDLIDAYSDDDNEDVALIEKKLEEFLK